MSDGTVRDVLDRRRRKREQILQGGGQARVDAQHGKGKLTARERLALLLDERSFIEQQPYVTLRATDFGLDRRRTLGDGVVTGSGLVDDRQVFVAAQDFTVNGGSLGEMHAERIVAAQNDALSNRVPFIQINDSGGARIQEGVLSLNGYARIFRANTASSGVIPQLSIILGPCAGGAVYSPAITDFIFMVDGVSNMFITGPQVIATVTGEKISSEDLGGSAAHCSRSGVAHFRYATEQECLQGVRTLLAYLPAHNGEDPPLVPGGDDVDRATPELLHLMPADPRRGYDVKQVITALFDRDSFLEVHTEYAPNVVVGFARWPAARLAYSPISPACTQRPWISTRRTRRPASCVSATPSTSPSSPWWTCPGFCREWRRSTAASSATVPRSSTPSPRRRCRRWR